jgi:hypothetical protein
LCVFGGFRVHDPEENARRVGVDRVGGLLDRLGVVGLGFDAGFQRREAFAVLACGLRRVVGYKIISVVVVRTAICLYCKDALRPKKKLDGVS